MERNQQQLELTTLQDLKGVPVQKSSENEFLFNWRT